MRKFSKRLLAVILSLLVVMSSMSMGAEARTIRRTRLYRVSRVRTIRRLPRRKLVRRTKKRTVRRTTRRTIRRTSRRYRRG